jgi:chromosome segregation ATPase
LRDARLENEWTRETLDAAKRTTETVVEERGWLQATQRENERELAWIRETLHARDEEVGARRKEVEWLQRSLEDKDRELAWRRETLAAKERVIASLRAAHAEMEQAWASLEAAFPERRRSMDAAGRRQSMSSEIRDLVAQRGSLRDALGDLERVEAALADAEQDLASAEGRVQETAQVGLAALEAQERLLLQELRPLLDEVVRTAGEEAQSALAEGGDDQLLFAVRATGVRVRRMLSELAWRRDEMRLAEESLRRGLWRMVLVGTLFGRRVRRWRSGRDPAARQVSDANGISPARRAGAAAEDRAP